MNKIYDTLYKIDTKGKVRVWFMEQEGSKHRTIAGLRDGKLVTSGWTHCEGTNVGRSNERDPVAQATFEIEAEYKKGLERDYHKTIEGAWGGAHFFEPMLAEKYKEFAPGYAQPKLDGVRCIAKADGLWSRQGKQIMGAPHILEALRPIFEKNPSIIIDGELYNHDFKDDFNSILSAIKKQKPTPEQLAKSAKVVEYHVYDLPSHKDVFSERTAKLFDLVDEIGGPIEYVDTMWAGTQAEYDDAHGMWLLDGYEGSMWRSDDLYEQKRSKTLRKRKEFVDEEFPISKIIEGDGNWSGYAKAVEFVLPDDKRTVSGERPKAGIKGNQEFARQLLADADKYNVVTVKYFALTPDGIPRFPVAIKFYEGEREF